VTVWGGGWGHNVGMSQYGGHGRARSGQTFLQILKAYYTGVDIGCYPIDIGREPGSGPPTMRQSFYAPNALGMLFVRNAEMRKLTVHVNEAYDVVLDEAELADGEAVVDLSPYLVTGVNTIQYNAAGHGSATVTVVVDELLGTWSAEAAPPHVPARTAGAPPADARRLARAWCLRVTSELRYDFGLAPADFLISANRARSFARLAVLFRFAIAARAFSPFACDISSLRSWHGNTIGSESREIWSTMARMDDLDGDGYALADITLAVHQCEHIASSLPSVVGAPRGGIRNLISHPTVMRLLNHERLGAYLWSIIGRDLVAVRATLFNKTAESNWRVQWHQDRAIAVRERHDVTGYGPWSSKAGVLRRAAESVLMQMPRCEFIWTNQARRAGRFASFPDASRREADGQDGHGRQRRTGGRAPCTSWRTPPHAAIARSFIVRRISTTTSAGAPYRICLRCHFAIALALDRRLRRAA
jgi:hypothetical protein